MARAIDAEKAIEVAQFKYNEWNLAMAVADGQREINLCFKKQELFKAVKAVLDCVPTLTPPNELLTLDELREMDGEPVWVDDEKTYAILQVWDDDNIDAIFSKPRGCIHAKYAIGMKIYRRPPEGEEDT